MPYRPPQRKEKEHTVFAKRKVSSTDVERHPDLKKGEAFIERWPDPNCSVCFGRGTRHRNTSTGLWEPCKCLGKVSWKEKLAFHIEVDELGHVRLRNWDGDKVLNVARDGHLSLAGERTSESGVHG